VITLKAVHLHNWLRYRGEHLVELRAGVYAVTAQYDENPRRSNWAGKTALVEAVPFALWGQHRKKLEDDWITDGERTGSVTMSLDVDGDEVAIARTRTRGQPTKLVVKDHTVAPVRELKGDEAQQYIAELLCMTERDFFITGYIAQKKMAEFVTMRPEPRMALVTEWLQLQPLEAACDAASTRLSEALDAQTQLEVEAATIRGIIAEGATAAGIGNAAALATPEELKGVVLDPARVLAELQRHAETWQDDLDQARGNVQLFERQRAELVRRHRDAEDAREYHRVVAEGVPLREKLRQVDAALLKHQCDTAQARVSELAGEQRVASDSVRRLQVVAAGEFDGQCPVACIECPATDEINGMRAENAAACITAEKQHAAVLAKRREADAALQQAQALMGAVQRDQARLDSLRDQARRLKPAAERVTQEGEPPEIQDDDVELRTAREHLEAVLLEQANVQRQQDRVRECIEKAEALEQQLAVTKQRVALLREAQSVLGRNGAQREIARRMLTDVETAANAALGDCGVDLRVGIRWSREGGGLAKSCEACGAHFPGSARVKVCTRCGAERGPLMVNKLEVVLSDTSGAAEDLAGAAIQLAAMAWLREERGSPWGVVLLDEPFGSLDEQHRQAFAAHLTTMLAGRYGAVQALVIAHHASIMDAMPCRVEIVAGPQGSWIGGVDHGEVRVAGDAGHAGRVASAGSAGPRDDTVGDRGGKAAGGVDRGEPHGSGTDAAAAKRSRRRIRPVA
jgi:DNA repair exonuclease SbcCD ATPase subunit